MKCRIGNLQDSCRVKRQKVPESVFGTAGVAVEQVGDVMVVSPGAADVFDPRTDELTGQLFSTRAEVILLT